MTPQETTIVTAYLGLGSNLGDSRAILTDARGRLAAMSGITLVAVSPLYESSPLGGPPGQGDYLNAVLAIRTTLAPAALLACCQAAENAFGRVRAERWGARTLDVDLLLYDVQVLAEKNLIIPHPRLHERSFVLFPLCDLAPELVHPVLGQTMRQLAGRPGLTPARRCADSW